MYFFKTILFCLFTNCLWSQNNKLPPTALGGIFWITNSNEVEESSSLKIFSLKVLPEAFWELNSNFSIGFNYKYAYFKGEAEADCLIIFAPGEIFKEMILTKSFYNSNENRIGLFGHYKIKLFSKPHVSIAPRISIFYYSVHESYTTFQSNSPITINNSKSNGKEYKLNLNFIYQLHSKFSIQIDIGSYSILDNSRLYPTAPNRNWGPEINSGLQWIGNLKVFYHFTQNISYKNKGRRKRR